MTWVYDMVDWSPVPRDHSTVSRAATARPGSPLALARLCVVYPSVEPPLNLGAAAIELGRTQATGAHAIDSPTLSRRHVAISWSSEAGGHVVTDLGSRNGSWINGVPLGPEPRLLRSEDVLRLGDVLLVYELGAQLAAPDGRLVALDAVPGVAASIRKLRGELERAAIDVAPVMIVGDTGTGKELIARELHRLSRRQGDLVIVNCAALSPQLIESQLFGHVRGAFTGATEAQAGLFRSAQGGTLFLDEIGDLPLPLQPKLLRAIEQREVQSVGAPKAQKVDVRVVAATHRRLAREVEAGEFRRDLYARLSLWELAVPSLSQRRVDILAWIDRLWRRRHEGAVPLRLDPDAAHALLCDPWPTNLRGIDRLVHGSMARRAARRSA